MLPSRPSRRSALRLEPLEGREVPATLVSPTTVTYQDIDGDNVSVVFSKPILSAANVNQVFSFSPVAPDNDNTVPQRLTQINLGNLGAGVSAAGAALTVTATRSPTTGGDGRANVGQILGLVDLGVVTIDGDLARINLGDGNAATPGLAGLAVHSLGRFPSAAPFLTVDVTGTLGSLRVKADVVGVRVNVQGAAARIGSVVIGGSLIGGADDFSGSISAPGGIGPVTVRGDLVGGAGLQTGSILSTGPLAAVTIGGSVRGAAGENSGRVQSFGPMGPAAVGGDLVGGAGPGSGAVVSLGPLAAVSVGRSVAGGAGSGSGAVTAAGRMGTVAIGGDLIGGSAAGTADLTESGFVRAQRIARLTVGGSVLAGTDATTGTFRDNGAVRAQDDINSVRIRGSLIGNPTNPAVISARGKAAPTGTTDLAIGSLTVRGRVEHALILAGVDVNGTARNADAQVGPVVVGGDWIASSLAAGAVPTDGFFGNADDAKMAGANVKDDPLVNSKVASWTVGGQVMGTFGLPGDHFGVVAEVIGTATVGDTVFPRNSGKSNDDFLVGTTGDVRVNEL